MSAATLDWDSADVSRGDGPAAGGSHPLSNEIDLCGATLDDHSSDVVEQMASLLSSDENARAQRFRFERDRSRFVVGRGILRILLGRHLARAPRELEFAYGANGKPFIAGSTATSAGHDAGPLRFNVTHAEGLALFAFTRTGEVGVDVEMMRDLPDFDGVAAAAFSPVELALWRAGPMASRRTEFFAAWTRQEAVLKAVGTGLGGVASPKMMSSFRVFPFQPAPGFAAALAAAPTAEWATLHVWQHDVRSHPLGAPQRRKRMRLADLPAAGALFL